MTEILDESLPLVCGEPERRFLLTLVDVPVHVEMSRDVDENSDVLGHQVLDGGVQVWILGLVPAPVPEDPVSEVSPDVPGPVLDPHARDRGVGILSLRGETKKWKCSEKMLNAFDLFCHEYFIEQQVN